MYAIVKTGGKQYRVEEGQSLLVEKLTGEDGASLELRPLLYVDGSTVVDAAEELARVTVSAKVLSQERGPKLRIVKFKPKRGYKRRTGHRQDLTRIEVTKIALARAKAAKSGSGSGSGTGLGLEFEGRLRWRIRRASAPRATAAIRTPSASASRYSPARR